MEYTQAILDLRHINHVRVVQGIGYNDLNHIKGECDGIAYRTWSAMLNRCYGKTYSERKPTYKDCSVCDEWLYFSNFKKWFDENYIDGYQLDKDILVRNNKLYSPETCRFVPNKINTLLLSCNSKRGKYPIGVTRYQGKYRARLHINGKDVTIGLYNTISEAFDAYKNRKEKYIKEIANEYYSKGEITKDIYDSLMNYEVCITD